MKTVSLIGSTGSIGRQTLDVVKMHKDKFSVKCLTARGNVELLLKQAEEFLPEYIGVTDTDKYKELKTFSNNKYKILAPDEANMFASTAADFIVVSCTGINGLLPTINALKNGKNVGLANKETLVTGGKFVIDALRKGKGNLFPIDSEHSAVWQSLRAGNEKEVKKVILTASGGPFVDYTKEELKSVTPSMALKHPNWNMGGKITIDSATLMNKGLEFIEAMYLFDLKPEQIEIVVHRQSIIHSMVEYIDNAVVCEMSYPTMIIPIQYAMTYPERSETEIKSLDFCAVGKFDFEKPRYDAFPCLRLALNAAQYGGIMPIVLNAANDFAVYEFLREKIGFIDIAKIVERELNRTLNVNNYSLEDIPLIDREVKERLEGTC